MSIDIFNKYLSRLQSNDNIDTVIEDMKNDKVYNVINHYVNLSSNSETISVSESKVLEVIIKILQFIYNNSSTNTGVSDSDYDSLYDLYIRSSGDMPSEIVGAPTMVGRKTAKHRYPVLRGTLDKIHFITNKDKGNDKKKSIEMWIDSVKKVLGNDVSLYDATITPKIDGVSVVFECDGYGRVSKALSRGDTDANSALDITHIFPPMKFEDFSLETTFRPSFGVKTEVCMSNIQYELLCKEYGHFDNTRSATSAIVNRIDSGKDNGLWKYLTVVVLSVVWDGDTNNPVGKFDYNNLPYAKVNLLKNFNELGDIFDGIASSMEEKGMPIDGMVVSFTREKAKELLGRKDNINKYEFAYKFPPPTSRTILEDVEFTSGSLGNITPVAKVKPIKMFGRTLKSISLGSMEIFESLDLHVGDEVIVKYEIIPYMTKDDTCKKGDGPKIKSPTHCKHCGEELVENPVLKCENPNCISNKLGRILNYLVKMKIPNISSATVEYLNKVGMLDDIVDLYGLKYYKEDIADLKGFGSKSAQIIIDSIDSRLKVTPAELLGSLGIPGVAIKTFQKILSIYNIYDLISLCKNGDIESLVNIDGISHLTGSKIINGINDNMSTIQELLRHLSLREVSLDNSSMTILFSGIRDSMFQDYLEKEVNVNVSDGYNKSVNLVITKDADTVTSKTKKAIKDGVEVITIDEAYRRFNYK